MKVVLDTNTWISGFLNPSGVPGKIVSAWRQAQFSVVISNPILEELKRVLNSPKIKKRMDMSSVEIEDRINFLRFLCDFIPVASDSTFSEPLLKDEDDQAILETLILGKADYLITGDAQLLILSSKYPILTAREFLELMG